jgi:hypothetical protein
MLGKLLCWLGLHDYRLYRIHEEASEQIYRYHCIRDGCYPDKMSLWTKLGIWWRHHRCRFFGHHWLDGDEGKECKHCFMPKWEFDNKEKS